MKKNITVTLSIDEADAIIDALAWADILVTPGQREDWSRMRETFANRHTDIRSAFFRVDAALAAEQRTTWEWLRHARGSASRALRDIWGKMIYTG